MRVRIPPRFKDADVSGLSRGYSLSVGSYEKRLFDNVRQGAGLVLMGPPGVGKTWAMAALTKAFVNLKNPKLRDRSHEFITAPELFEKFEIAWERDASTYDSERDQTWIATLVSVRWLVINDLGKEYRGGKQSEYVPYKFGRLIRARSERQLTTHITTNMNAAALREAYGDSAMSLLSESGEAYTIDGPDLRRAKPGKNGR